MNTNNIVSTGVKNRRTTPTQRCVSNKNERDRQRSNKKKSDELLHMQIITQKRARFSAGNRIYMPI